MPGDRAVCHAGNALRPSALLSRLFNIPLARPRPSSVSYRCSAPARSRHDRHIDTNSLAVTLEAHRLANRASIIRKIGAEDVQDQTVWFKPELPVDRFDPLPKPPKPQRTRYVVEKEGEGSKPRATGEWQWSDQAVRSRSLPLAKIGARERELPPADYVGQVVEPLYNRDDVRDEDLPWFQASRLPNAKPLERLRFEIEAFESYLRPTPDEQAGRDAVIAQTRDVWSSFSSRGTKQLALDTFGSERSGLAIATSDIDLRVYSPEADKKRKAEKAPRYAERRQFSNALTKAFPYYQSDTRFMLVFLRFARYPLVSMQHVESSLDVQIVCSNDTSHARSVMAKFMEELPALRAVYTLFKYMFEVRGFADVFRGGMGSYSIFYMVAAAMKLRGESATDDAAAQLLAVLDFYSDFDTTKFWISLDPLEIMPKIENKPTHSKEEKQKLKAHERIGLQNDEQPYLLCIRDPSDRTNDVGRKTFGWKHLQATMKKLKEDLRESLEKDDRSLFLPILVGRGFDLAEARRQKLAAFGRAYYAKQGQNASMEAQQASGTMTVSSGNAEEVFSEPLQGYGSKTEAVSPQSTQIPEDTS
ncbi:PAP/25A-associated [Macrophomina phaseolina MS6]|uniref:polynucleotide adenylyltransferase n=1 Tax=Macrophomina phaseolina (strain MS6) TaxID=1126212 RepID=K2RYS0_MACPH|nr:PAP/25A-associated [Macrophomina phaseolina MS6]